MTVWNKDLEDKIRKVGDYAEAQVKDLLDPKTPARRSVLRVLFRAVTQGVPAMKKAAVAAGWKFTNHWVPDMMTLADIAERNCSDAAEKIRKALPYVDDFVQTFRNKDAHTLLRQIQAQKKLNIKY
ncbi:MAG: hypothetical protein ACAH80_16245 [Alphaproteobacteria bacterium]